MPLDDERAVGRRASRIENERPEILDHAGALARLAQELLHHGEVVFSNTIAGLREFQRGRTVTVSLHRPPAIETLRGIAGVATVDDEGNGRFRIRFAPDTDPTAALVGRAGAEDWGLHQLTPAQTSLEDVFVHLTRGDSA